MKKPYPIKLFNPDNKEDILINDEIRLYDFITDKLKKEVTEKIKIIEVLSKYGIHKDEEVNTVQLIDNRTMNIIMMFDKYRSAKHLIRNKILDDSFFILERLQPRLF